MTGTCQVDFYVLADPVRSAESLACQLALMAWEQGHRVCVRTEDELEAQRIDELMWEQPPGRFLP
ncbi:MAG: DNA polymerase III subunit chi, partial [Xanthomonadales bacterium]|nr:DNA polymerase III subunit chi [Xanthomonadales bacterium]